MLASWEMLEKHLEMMHLIFRPKVNFDIRMLKKIQLMEFPLIRDWIKQLVDDSLKISKFFTNDNILHDKRRQISLTASSGRVYFQ